MRILTASQSRQLDEQTCRELGIPNLLLMENAAQRLVEYVEEYLGDPRGRRVWILAGKGNNGGDALAAARQLLMRGALPSVGLLADPAALQGDAGLNLRLAEASGVQVTGIDSGDTLSRWTDAWQPADLLLDGMLGTGIRGPARGLIAEAIEQVNRRFAGHVLSIDVPSGLESDSAQPPGPAVCADVTVTFTAPKPCHVLQPAAQSTGRLIVAPIGTPQRLIENLAGPRTELFQRDLLSPFLRSRPETGHKGDFGRVLVLAGSRGMAGAAALAGLGALKSGAGLVTVAVPQGIQSLVAAFGPELMTVGLAETSSGRADAAAITQVLELAARADVIAAGPGLGRDDSTRELLSKLLHQCALPLVLDADALNLLSDAGQPCGSTKRPVVLTPHPGEMARLTGESVASIEADRRRAAGALASSSGCYVVLKGSRTVTAAPAGTSMINPTGNPGMATGGSGDVLCGMVASLLGQQLRLDSEQAPESILRAVATAVCWHGLAGDCAASVVGPLSLVAGDIVQHLPGALKLLLEPEIFWAGGSRRPILQVGRARKQGRR